MEKAYETYKNSGVEWIGEIPESWNVNLLKRGLSLLTDYEANGSFSSVKQNVNFPDKEEDEYAWYVRATDLEKKTYGDRRNLRWVDKETYNFLERTTLYGNELLVAKRGEIGKIYIMPEVKIPSTLAPNLYLLRFNNKINSKFAYYYFQSELGSEELKSKNRSTTIGAVYKDDLKDIKFIYPSLQEQTQIAAYLDYHTQLIDTLISKKETLIQKLQEQRQAIINEAVTKGLNKDVVLKDSGVEWLGEIPEHWEVVKLSHYSEVIGGSTPRSNVDEYWEGDISWVTTDDLGKVKNKTINQSRRTITEKGLSSCSASLVPENSLIISCRAPIGHLAINKMPTATNQGCKSIVPKEFYITDYLYYFFVTAKKDLQSLGTGSTFIEISTSDLKNYKVLKPSIKEQNEIVSYLDVKMLKLDLVFEEITKSIQKLKAYRQSLISEAVTGKIDVRDWQQPKNKS
ncbi:restriction endonuclease subunit S [Tenacibaculum maritimum]|uniref:restriction endonuclease subunit S n=1 Tax=Tenacibaculum maritimum TaxID=107401 RepID=UPI00387646C4